MWLTTLLGVLLGLFSFAGIPFQVRATNRAKRAALVSHTLSLLPARASFRSEVRLRYIVTALLVSNVLVGASILSPPHSTVAIVLGWLWFLGYLGVSVAIVISGIIASREPGAR